MYERTEGLREFEYKCAEENKKAYRLRMRKEMNCRIIVIAAADPKDPMYRAWADTLLRLAKYWEAKNTV